MAHLYPPGRVTRPGHALSARHPVADVGALPGAHGWAFYRPRPRPTCLAEADAPAADRTDARCGASTKLVLFSVISMADPLYVTARMAEDQASSRPCRFDPESRSVRRTPLAQKDPATRAGEGVARGRPLGTKATGRPFAKVRLIALRGGR